MPDIRRATPADAEAIAGQRFRMFTDAEVGHEAAKPEMRDNFVPWVRARLAAYGDYPGRGDSQSTIK